MERCPNCHWSIALQRTLELPRAELSELHACEARGSRGAGMTIVSRGGATSANDSIASASCAHASAPFGS